MNQLSFTRVYVGALVVLAVLVAGFATLDRVQGPKLASAQVDTTAVVSKPDQPVQLFTSERIAPVEHAQVGVSPSAPFTVTASGQLISVQFTNPLRYATSYRISVKGVTSADDGAVSTIDYSFTTSASQIYYLKRSGGAAPDRIYQTSIGSSSSTVVYSATRIQDFAVLDNLLAVVRLDARGDSSLSFVSSTGMATTIKLPGAGTIDLLRGNSDTGLFGFTFTSAGNPLTRRYSSTLFTVSPDVSAAPKPVKGLDGTPLSVINWYFVPVSNYLVVQSAAGSILLLDSTNTSNITPLGSELQLYSVSNDGKAISANSSTYNPIAIAIPSGKISSLAASALGGRTADGGAAQVLPNGWLQLDSVYDATTGGFTQHLAFDNGTLARELYTPPNPLGSIDSFVDSPNNEYVSIETTPDVATSVADGYLVNGTSTSVRTVFVDIATGKQVKSVAGFDAQW